MDTKGDLARNYGTIAKKYYGYHVSVIDLRNQTRSDGSNLLTLINRYMDIAREHPDNLAARAKAEKYAKILAKTIVNPGGDDQDRGQNAFFYDAAEGLLTSVILLLAEYVPPNSILPLFSAGRSRKLTLVPIIQSLAQLEKNYGKEGAEIIADNCQDTIFGGFAPNSQTAETLSKALGSRTVLTGSVSKGKGNTSQSLQMAERAQREVYYAGKEELLMNIKKSLYAQHRPLATPKADGYMSSYGEK